jgi:predicted transport protein
MLFEINEQNVMNKVKPDNFSNEVQIEKYLISNEMTEEKLLSYDIFKEWLLLIDNQAVTKDKKRADIIALDKNGNLVIIELKKDKARLGVEMQALQYLAEFSQYKGQAFIDKFKRKDAEIEVRIKSFIEKLEIEKLNQNGRIILIAQDFDNSLLSMGEWLSNQGVAFRCLQYKQLKIGDGKYLSFSVYFDRSLDTLFQLRFNPQRTAYSETPQIYWHNIGLSTQDWWSKSIENKFIATSFDNAPNDKGETILKSLIKGDRIIAFAKGFGAIGWGEITCDPQADKKAYVLVDENSEKDFADGRLRHRLKIDWKATLELKNCIKTKEVLDRFGIYHPVQTSSMIKSNDNAERLIKAIEEKVKLLAATR